MSRLTSRKEKDLLCTNLRQLRVGYGYTAQNIADFLDMSRSAYSYYEIGKTVPDIFTLNQLAEIYDINTQDFLSKMKPTEEMLRARPRKRVVTDPKLLHQLTGDEKSLILMLRTKRIAKAIDFLRTHFS